MAARRIRALCFFLCSAACLPCSLGAQGSPALTMPVVSLRAVALDFDAGRNMIYCYYGLATTSEVQIRVDSLHVVSSPSECSGVGFGFISRIADKPMIEAMLRGLISAHPAFRIITAFYGTEAVEFNGESIRAARALSVLRPVPLVPVTFGS